MPKRDSYRHGTPCWVDLTTADLEEAKVFYKEFLGWDFAEETFGGSAPYTLASTDGHRVAGLMQQTDEQLAHELPAAWNTYVAVDDLSCVLSRVEDLGGHVLMPPIELTTQGSMAAIADPAGTLLGLWEAGEHFGAELVNEPKSLIWNELISDDLSTVKDFYVYLLGWTAKELDMPGGEYVIAEVDGEAVAGLVDAEQRQGVNRWEAYFAVADIQKMQGVAGQLDGSVGDVSDIGLGLIAACEDPQGARFHVMQPAEPA